MRLLKSNNSASPRVRLREPSDDFMLKTLVPVVLLVFASGPAGGWGDTPLWIDVCGWMVIAALAACLVRSWSMGVYVSPDHLEIAGLSLRRRVDWGQIKEFSIGYPEATFWKWAPVAVLADGTRVPMNAIQAPQPWTRPKNAFDTRAVEKLRELHQIAIRDGGRIKDERFLEFDRRLGS